ncbi:hypothetical protein [Goekera deserti]|nr:hypothetical protein [Goekera deserti]
MITGTLLGAVAAGTWLLSVGVDHVYRCTGGPARSAHHPGGGS